MEAEIISFADFKKEHKITVVKDKKVLEFLEEIGMRPQTVYEFVEQLQEYLSDEDFLDFWDAVFSKDKYETVDEDIKDFVDAYYEMRA
jgi:hypothetical protein